MEMVSFVLSCFFIVFVGDTYGVFLHYGVNFQHSIIEQKYHELEEKCFDRGRIAIHNSLTMAHTFSQPEFPSAILKSIQELSKIDALYCLNASTFRDEVKVFYPSCVRAMKLLEFNNTDVITMWMDKDNSLITITLQVNEKMQDVSFPQSGFVSNDVPQSSIRFVNAKRGPRVNVIGYLKKIAQERLKESSLDNRSFFAKYWIYIVPVVVLLLISSSSSQQEGSNR